MAHTTGPHTRGYVVIKEDTTGAWVLCRDGCWVSLQSAQEGHLPLATRVRLCPDMRRAQAYARRHTFATPTGARRNFERPRVISARAAGLPQAVCQ
jgi:hypothetical protein